MKKLLSLMLASVITVSALAACGTTEEPADTTGTDSEPTEEQITLKIYAQYADDDTKVPYDYAVEKVKEKFPNVTLELDIQAQDDGAKLQTYAATGNLPDIFQVGTTQIETFKESENIMVLDDIAKSTGFLDKVQPSASNILYNEDGHIYAFPYAGNELVVLYYNKAIFEEYGVEVPETMDDLMAAVKVFNENDIIPLSLFGKEKWITTALYDVFATRYIPEGIWGLDTGKTSLEDEAYTMGAAKLREFVDAGLLPDGVANLNYDQAASLFYEGKAAMFLNGQWEIQGSTDKLGDDVDWMYYPVAEGYEQNKFAMSGGGAAGGYAVNPNGEHAELAAEVAAYISEMYCEAKYLYRANPILALQVADGLEPDEAFPPMMQKLAVEIPNMTSTTKFAWGLQEPTFKVSIEDQSQFLITPDYTVEEFTAEVKKVLDRVER